MLYKNTSLIFFILCYDISFKGTVSPTKNKFIKVKKLLKLFCNFISISAGHPDIHFSRVTYFRGKSSSMKTISMTCQCVAARKKNHRTQKHGSSSPKQVQTDVAKRVDVLSLPVPTLEGVGS